MTECFPSRRWRVDLDGCQARRRAIFADEAHTPRVAEATLEERLGRLDAPPPAAAREEERDVRVLEVDWDDQGERFKPWRSVVAESGNVTFEDWPIEGSSATLPFAKPRQQQSPTAWFESWARRWPPAAARTTRCRCLWRRSRGSGDTTS